MCTTAVHVGVVFIWTNLVLVLSIIPISPLEEQQLQGFIREEARLLNDDDKGFDETLKFNAPQEEKSPEITLEDFLILRRLLDEQYNTDMLSP